MQVDNMISEKMKYKFLAEGFDSGDRIGRSGKINFSAQSDFIKTETARS
jgi:hypothetical protein